MIIRSKVQKEAKKHSMRVSSGFMHELDAKLGELIKAAANRARKNHRTTLMEQDL